ncbi:MAG: hypothetical protein EXQ97_01895 [Alphaproteobacteria bacterium]|nr:hypothetical protein [Alphaproteobacteria bacterium]
MSSGSLTSLNTSHSCSWRGFAASKERPPTFASMIVAMMGAYVVAPADVQAHLLGRNTVDGVVDSLDGQFYPALEGRPVVRLAQVTWALSAMSWASICST